MKIILTICLSLILNISTVFAQNNVEFSASDNWLAYMNVFQLPAAGGGYEFGSQWEIDKLKTLVSVAENTLSLQPNFNTYAENSTDIYWVNQSTMEGNKDMEANTFAEPGASFNGQDLTFSGAVVANTLADGYTANFFIKALDPNNDYQDALGGSKVAELPESGAFTVSATAAELAPGLVIQYGFAVRGPNANPANEAMMGSIRIGNMVSSTDNVVKEATTVFVAPNPANDFLNITSESMIHSYEIKNLSGQLLMKGTETTVNIANLNTGLYVAVVNLGDRREVVKFVKN